MSSKSKTTHQKNSHWQVVGRSTQGELAAGWCLLWVGRLGLDLSSKTPIYPRLSFQGKSLDWCMEKKEELGESSVEKVVFKKISKN